MPLDDYEPVADRLDRFWKTYPNGRIDTAIVRTDETEVVMVASAYRDIADTMPAAVGYAQELRTRTGVNATSWVENCETSAIGRALANLGFAAKGKRPSREEMAKVARNGKPPAHVLTELGAALHELGFDTREAQANYCAEVLGRKIRNAFDLTDADVVAVQASLTEAAADEADDDLVDGAVP